MCWAPAWVSPSTCITPGGTRSCGAQIARAGRDGRILAHHICDWLVPTRDLLLDRGMMGDGVIDLKQLRADIEQAGFHGPQEVEIFSSRELVETAR